ncbi:MAG: NAD(P)/FAD-dependent oxidoreductase [Thermoplasmata archaeon]
MYDVVIVGAGPAGLTAGIFATSRKLNTLILDAKVAGGQLKYLYPTKIIHDYPSHHHIEARKLGELMVDHARESGCDVHENEEVKDLKKKEEGLAVITERGEYEAKTVILAIGMGLFEPRKLGVPGEEEFAEKGVYYRVRGKETFAGKRALFIGGGDTALEMALSVVDVADHVYLAHRKNVFRAMETNVEAVEKSSIEVLFNTELKEVHGDQAVTEAVVFNNQTGEETTIPLEAVVINIGFSPKLESVQDWGIELEGKSIKVSPDMRTSMEGVFACGDIITYPGKDKRIVTACGEAATAAISAYKYIKKPYWA